MASEFLLSFAAEQVLKKLCSYASGEIRGAWGLEADLKRLEDSTQAIIDMLQDAEEKQKEDKRVGAWMLKLQGIAYVAEDVLDKFVYETLRRKVEVDQLPPIRGHLRNFFSCSNPVTFRLRMAHKVKEINESLAEFKNQALTELTLRSITRSTTSLRAPRSAQLDRETDSRLDVSQVPIGREGDVSTIITMLADSSSSSSSQQRLTVVSVVGMAGLGKTTLVKLVFKQAKELKLFGHTIWYCVSEDFDFKNILRGMLQALGLAYAGAMTDVEPMLDHLEKELEGENFLLVLDDVWNEVSDKWYSLKNRLGRIRNKNGNVVLVTTRSKKVASTMETHSSHIHDLEGLSNDECWSIIKQQICKNGGVSISHEMEITGKAIAGKCGGLPLAAAVVGGILWSEGVETWSSIKEDRVWDAVKQSNGIMPILRLSFDHLPSPLKPCFAYCSLFPKDFVFGKEQLVEMWMAEGFLETTSINRGRKGMLMEEIGDEYFNLLLANSFFQDAEKDSLGNVTRCKMHDLVHDLALSISKLETFATNASSKVETSNANLRRLSITCEDAQALMCEDEQALMIQGLPEFLRDGASKLRSFFSNVDVFHISPNFKSLRTLVLNDAGINKLPDSIGKLKHLRYIDISYNYLIENLPKSITKLYHLQTLRFIGCDLIEELPREMKKLVSLRHIYFSKKNRMTFLNTFGDDGVKNLKVAELGCLTNLQSLSVFVVGLEKGYKIEELGSLKELRGEIKMVRLENVRDGTEAASAKLHEKTKLTTLSMEWNRNNGNQHFCSSSSSYNDEEVLQGLQPPMSVQSLLIKNFMGERLPLGCSWMPMNLLKLELVDCERCKVLPSIGHLPLLKILKIKSMRDLKSIDKRFYGESNSNNASFPSLEKFTLKDMGSLVEWVTPTATVVVCERDETSSSLITAFPRLDKLVIDVCPRLRSLPISILSSLSHLEIDGCDDLRYLSDKFHGFMSLQYLKLAYCKSLESIPSSQDLKSLQELEILDCDKLASLPLGLQFCTSLKTLRIDSCEGLTAIDPSVGLKFCTSLRYLSISSCQGIISVPEDDLIELASLVDLNIFSCPKLTSFPEDVLGCSLTRLNSLWIGGFSKKLEEFPGLNSIHHLHASLRKLVIKGWPKLKSLPHQLQHLTSLTQLSIIEFDCMEALPQWVTHLSSLNHLEIERCETLKSLPTATAMQRLSKLDELQIIRCPLLKERCAKDNGPEWSNISHIPEIRIEFEYIQSRKSWRIRS